MNRVEYKDWRIAVFQRDNYACQCCGDSGGVYLHADHIKEYASHTEERHNIDNGITLCYRCHYKKTFPNVEFNETTALRWGVPKKYRKEELGYCK
jgi:5-methylcytosine-specific restriction endonuclease McrA